MVLCFDIETKEHQSRKENKSYFIYMPMDKAKACDTLEKLHYLERKLYNFRQSTSSIPCIVCVIFESLFIEDIIA